MSVVGSLATVMVARLWGYPEALGVAMVAYAGALVLVGFLGRGGRVAVQG